MKQLEDGGILTWFPAFTAWWLRRRIRAAGREHEIEVLTRSGHVYLIAREVRACLR